MFAPLKKRSSHGVNDSDINSSINRVEEDQNQDLEDTATRPKEIRFELDDYEGISPDIIRQIELMKISNLAQSKIDSKWTGDPFIEY